MTFGPESTNVSSKLTRIKEKLRNRRVDEPTYSEALDGLFAAVKAAVRTDEERYSDFAESLGQVAVVLGDLSEEDVRLWVPYTEPVVEGQSIRRDGYLTDGKTHESFDVTSASDICCVTREERGMAVEAWERGDVLLSRDVERHGVQALVVPVVYLTEDTLGEALERHFIQT